MKRGDIYYIDLEEKDMDIRGSEQGGKRPCLIIQNDIGNKHSATTIVAIITTKDKSNYLPTHVEIKKRDGLYRDSVVSLEQIRTVDKSRLINKIAKLNDIEMLKIKIALQISLGLNT